jgi:hypothetical protein
MKEKFLYFTLVLVCAGLWFKLQASPYRAHMAYADAMDPAEGVLISDQKKLERNLKKETTANEKWVMVNDYSIPVHELVNKSNAKDFFKLVNGSISDLASCLKKDFCGMERRNENDPYFDDSRTPGHILLGRNLEILKQSLVENPDLKNDVDWDLIRELTESGNEKIQVLSVDLLKEYGTARGDTEKMLKITDDYKGNAKALALAELAQHAKPEEKGQVINSIEKSFATDDPNTVISVLEKMDKMKLSTGEKEQTVKNLCRFKENGADDPNWKMIRYDAKRNGVDVDVVCP